MSSTARSSHLPTASQAPCSSAWIPAGQRLVALTDVMQTLAPLARRAPAVPRPAQLPGRPAPTHRAAAGQRQGQAGCALDAPCWHISPLPRAGRLLAHLPADPVPGAAASLFTATAACLEPDGQPAAVHDAMLESLKECLGPTRPILLALPGPMAPPWRRAADPGVHPGVDGSLSVPFMRRQLRTSRPPSPGALELLGRRLHPAHAEPALLSGRCHMLAPCLDGALLEQEKPIGVLSLGMPRAPSSAMEHPAAGASLRPVCSATGVPDPVATDARTSAPPRGFAATRPATITAAPLLREAMGLSGAPHGLDRRVSSLRPGSSGSFPAAWWRRCLRCRRQAHASRTSAPGREILPARAEPLRGRSGPAAIPSPASWLALGRQGLCRHPLPGARRCPWGSFALLLATPGRSRTPLLDVLYEQRERAASELQRLANDRCSAPGRSGLNTHDGLLVMDHGASSSRSMPPSAASPALPSEEMLGSAHRRP